jgi:phosphatidate cytidylyltransferase
MEQVHNDFGAGRDPSRSFERDDTSSAYDRPTGQTSRTDATGGYDAGFGSGGYGGYGEPSGEISTGMSRPYGRTAERGSDPSGSVPLPPRREPGRITIGTDPSGMPRRTPDPGRRRSGPPPRPGRPGGSARGVPTAAVPRNMSNALIVGAGLAVAFVIALMIDPKVVLAIIVVVLAIAAYEYFGKVTEKGYRPAVAPGIAACVCAPLAAYWLGDATLPLVVAFAFMAGAGGFIGSSGVESGPLPNMAITTMGVVWIGLLGSYAALILRYSTALEFGGPNHHGTDTLFMLALGVAANDIGALFVGSAVGKTPLRAWISPSKTIEGFLGGAFLTFIALFIASKLNDKSDWSDMSNVMWLVLVIAVLAPMGDLTESMFKRNLEIKDFGTIIQGHGGVLDRFDGFLFALPGVYYLTWVLFR